MLTVVIESDNNINVADSSIYFGLVSAPPERQLCSSMFDCRDYLNDYMQSVIKRRVNDTNINSWLVCSGLDPDFERLRLLIGTREDKETKKKIFFAKKLINIIEKEMKCNTTSKIATVKIQTTGARVTTNNTQHFLVTGPSEWMLSPQALSFITFIFKSCFYTSYDIIKKYEEAATVTDIKNYFQEVYDFYLKNYSTPYVNKYVSLFLEHIDFFIKKFNKIFSDGAPEERFSINENMVHSGWGIMNLFKSPITTQLKNKGLEAKYNKAMAEFKKEKE